MIALIDYGAGNLTSVKKALASLGAEFTVPETPTLCEEASALIIPGVGHFSATMALDAPWRREIGRAVDAGTPLLGICVGMQWLYEGSEEAPDVPGLGVLRGRVRLLRGDATQRLKIPHVGWNALELQPASPKRSADADRLASTGLSGRFATRRNGEGGSRLLSGLEPGAHVYFTHSYAAPVTADCVASTTHAESFAAAVERDHVFGVQFHPEKSGDAGLQILRNFLSICG